MKWKNLQSVSERKTTRAQQRHLAYMAKEIIEKLGGYIAVESVLNTGTAFPIEIPNKLNTKPLNNYFE